MPETATAPLRHSFDLTTTNDGASMNKRKESSVISSRVVFLSFALVYPVTPPNQRGVPCPTTEASVTHLHLHHSCLVRGSSPCLSLHPRQAQYAAVLASALEFQLPMRQEEKQINAVAMQESRSLSRSPCIAMPLDMNSTPLLCITKIKAHLAKSVR